MCGLDPAKSPASDLLELLELFELDGNQKKLIVEHSKGMRMRAVMAALIHRPNFFLMDEPFEGVDAVGACLMKDILLKPVRRGATIFPDLPSVLGKGRAPLRPRRHHQRWKGGRRRHHGRAPRRIGNPGRRLRPSRRRWPHDGDAGLVMKEDWL